MNKKNPLILIIFIALGVSSLIGQEISFLEKLWNAALQENVGVQTSEMELETAALRRSFYSTIYAPSVSVSGSNTFAPKEEKEDGILSDMSTAALAYSQPFTGGANLSTSLSYSLRRPVTPDGTYALQSPNAILSLSQGLKPWWIQGLGKNPQKSLLENSVEFQKIQLSKEKKTVLVTLTQAYIDLRKTERAISLYENSLSVSSETIVALEVLLKQGAISMTKVWDEKQRYMDEANLLLLNQNERSRLKEEIRNMCGILSDSSNKNTLPKLDTNEIQRNNISVTTNLDSQEIDTQIESILLGSAQRIQNAAPVVNFSADLTWPLEDEKLKKWNKAWATAWDDTQKPLYTLSLSIDISPLFNRSGVRDKKIETNTIAMLKNQKAEINTAEQNNKALLQATLERLQMQTKQYRLAQEQTKEMLADAETLAEQGALTTLELKNFRNQLEKRNTTLADAEDQIWYLEWYLAWWFE